MIKSPKINLPLINLYIAGILLMYLVAFTNDIRIAFATLIYFAVSAVILIALQTRTIFKRNLN